MRGKWEKARGTIVESFDAPPGATRPTLSMPKAYHDYVVKVAGPGGVVRVQVSLLSLFIHAIGEPMLLEVNYKTQEARVDLQAMAASEGPGQESGLLLGHRAQGRWRAVLGTIVESPDAPAGATAPTLTPSSADHFYLIDICEPGGMPVRASVSIYSKIVHAVGEQVPVEMNERTGQVRPDLDVLADMAAHLAHDPAAQAHDDGLPASREERLERLRELRASAAQRASHAPGDPGQASTADSSGGSGDPSTFDDIGPF